MPHTLETRIKMHNSAAKGKESINWKGGITSMHRKLRLNFEYKLWREAVFIRDNWICQKCLLRGGKLNAHHIHNFADFKNLRYAIDNGITLCFKCHKKFHKNFGKKNNNLYQINNFINSLTADTPDTPIT
jgi:5-methylcytosine-specific restriction endonuclease McrA